MQTRSGRAAFSGDLASLPFLRACSWARSRGGRATPPLPGGVLVLLRGRYRTYFFKKVAVDNFLLDDLCLKFFLSLYFMIINTSVHAYYYIQLVVNLKLI